MLKLIVGILLFFIVGAIIMAFKEGDFNIKKEDGILKMIIKIIFTIIAVLGIIYFIGSILFNASFTER